MRPSLLSPLIVALACSAERPHPAAPPVAPPPRPRVVWPRFAEVASWPRVGEPFANTGHAGAGALAEVRVNPEARAAYEHLVKDSELKDGTLVALFHEQPGGAGPVYVMEKVGGAWLFMTCRPDGTDLEPAEPTQGTRAHGCRGCHSEGVADWLFGPPRRPAGAP